MISWNKIIVLLICGLGLNSAIQAQTVHYYQLIKTKVNGVVSTQNNGGQFICIYDDFCFDCDKNGKGVDNGQLHLKTKENILHILVKVILERIHTINSTKVLVI